MQELFGTNLILKRARPVLALKRARYYFRAQLTLDGGVGWGGLVFAYSDINNHFRVAMRQGDQCINLQKRENGRWYTLARGKPAAPLKSNHEYELSVLYGA